jgi:hypothetical protein
MSEEKYLDSPRNVDITAICTNERFGTDANFKEAIIPLQVMVQNIVELEDLDYKGNLTLAEVNNIDTARITVIRFIEEIKNFSLSASNPIDIRNNIVNQIENYYQNSFAGQTRPSLTYLKEKMRSNARDEEQLKKFVTLNNELEERIKYLKEKEQKVKDDEDSLAQRQGIVSSKYLAKEFTKEAVSSNNKAVDWQKYWVLPLSVSLVVMITGIFWGYFRHIRPLADKYLSIEYTISGVTLVALVFFYLRIVLRNTNVEKHSASLNRHRANVAATIENLLESGSQDQGLRDALLKEGSAAMFNIGSTGYLDKEQMEVSTPLKEAITLINNKS